jgi:hypothetical protein
MKTLEQDIKALRKKAKSWLAILIYQCARGQTQLDALNQRLMSLYQPVFKPETLRETIRNAMPTSLNEKDTAGIKKRIVSRLTPGKVERRMLDYSLAIGRKNRAQKKNAFTLGRFVIIWAVLTHQSTQEFLIKVEPGINRIYQDWHKATGCSGLSDEECRSHSRESARFWSGFLRILIRETPEENLTNFVQGGIQALDAVIGMPGLEEEIYKLLGKASRVITRDAAQKIESALKVNPGTRDKIDIPELKALVLREEARLGWSKHTEKDALKTLRSNLSPELKEAVDNDEVIRSSMEAVGRRGLFNNLVDAINGQLRPRLIDYALRWLKKYLLPKPRIIWDEEEGGNEVYKILMKGCEDGKG